MQRIAKIIIETKNNLYFKEKCQIYPLVLITGDRGKSVHLQCKESQMEMPNMGQRRLTVPVVTVVVFPSAVFFVSRNTGRG